MKTEKLIEEITAGVVERIRRDYYLVPRNVVPTATNKVAFLEYVLEFVCQEMDVDRAELCSGNRVRSMVYARRMYVYMARKFGEKHLSFSVVGKFINKDHASCLHARNQLLNEMSVDKKYRAEVLELESKFQEKMSEEIKKLHNPEIRD
jgi:chromosomal replication initiation ATPase DnaA